MEKNSSKLIIVIILLILITISGIQIYKSVSLNQNCTGYLKRAADANTVEMANAELSKAINYLETKGLTNGYTSILWKTPDEDIGFWYNNLKESQKELNKIDSTSSTLEKTNLLMKLRETLIDNEKDGDSLTIPNGLVRYPNNQLYFFINIIALILVLYLLFVIIISVR